MSSQNSTKHGCCSRKIIIRGESEEEFNQLLEDWLREYNPQNSAERAFVLQAVEAQWVLRRNTNRYYELEQSLEDKTVLEWTEQDHKQIERFTRYKITAERSFARAFKNVEQIRKCWAASEQRLEEPAASERPASPHRDSETEVQAIRHPAPNSFHAIEQRVGVVTEKSKTVTKPEPTDEQFVADSKAIGSAPGQI